MDKKKLSQLRPLKRELVLIDKRLEKLYERQENVPTVLGKVTGSSRGGQEKTKSAATFEKRVGAD